jgi:hypothetical protein
MEKYPNAPSLQDLGVAEYPAGVIDEDETVVIWEADDKSEWFVYHAGQCPVVNVAAFFRESLKGMKDLEEKEEDGAVTFKFKTPDGVPIMIEITPQNPSQPDGPSDIDVIVNP